MGSICCPTSNAHNNWWGAKHCSTCGIRLISKKVTCKNCKNEVFVGNDIQEVGTRYCDQCGKNDLEVTITQAPGRNRIPR